MDILIPIWRKSIYLFIIFKKWQSAFTMWKRHQICKVKNNLRMVANFLTSLPGRPRQFLGQVTTILRFTRLSQLNLIYKVIVGFTTASVSKRQTAMCNALMFRLYVILHFYVGLGGKTSSESAEEDGNGADARTCKNFFFAKLIYCRPSSRE